MAKNKLLKKIGKVAKEKADELASDYVDKAKSKASEIIRDYANDAGNRVGKYISKSINKGAQNITSKIDKKESEEQVVDVAELHEEEYGPDEVENGEIKVEESMSDEDDDKFVDGITSKVVSTGLKGLCSRGEVLTVVDNLAQIAGEVEKFREVQKTKRVAIEAEKQAVITKLNLQKKLLMKYLDETFDERRENFKKIFDVIDDALIKGNIQQLAVGLNSVNELAKSSPFKDLANINQVGKALEDENHEWDF